MKIDLFFKLTLILIFKIRYFLNLKVKKLLRSSGDKKTLLLLIKIKKNFNVKFIIIDLKIKGHIFIFGL